MSFFDKLTFFSVVFMKCLCNALAQTTQDYSAAAPLCV